MFNITNLTLSATLFDLPKRGNNAEVGFTDIHDNLPHHPADGDEETADGHDAQEDEGGLEEPFYDCVDGGG